MDAEIKTFIDNKIIETDGTITLRKLKDEIEEAFKDCKSPCMSMICNYLNYESRLLLKRVTQVDDKRNDNDTIRNRKKYVESSYQEGVVYEKNCIFVDEAGFNVNMVRGQARAKPNRPAVVHTESKRGVNYTILMAISQYGMEQGTTGNFLNRK